MSKYDILKGLVKEILPSGEKVLMHEGDDLFHTLHGLDERMIENLVSKRDAYANARDASNELQKRLWALPQNRGKSAEQFAEEFAEKTKPNFWDMNVLTGKDPHTIKDFHFPKEYEEHFNPDQISQLSSQYKNAGLDYHDALVEKLKTLDRQGLYGATVDEDALERIADERFKKIRAALKNTPK